MAETSDLFAERRQAGQLVVTEQPKLDLEIYIANYRGRTRLDRLAHIACTSPQLSRDAFHIAVDEAKLGLDMNYYIALASGLQKLDPEDPRAAVDMAWVEQRTKEGRTLTERLEAELKAYKNNLIKESIRMGTNDLATHLARTGDIPAAIKWYSRAREVCGTPVHIAVLALHQLILAIHLQDWMSVQTQSTKLGSIQIKPEEKSRVQPIVNACQGLAHLGVGDYPNAAKAFLVTDVAYLTLNDSMEGVSPQKDIMTGNDIAVYGGLCALASMDRAELQENVLDNSSFRQFLELEPHVRRAITFFCGSKYKQALEILEAYRADWCLDVYLAPHVETIFERVRQKSIVQYFVPFSCVTLDEMHRMFASHSGRPIEEELVDMIRRGTLDARIDLVDRLLLAPPQLPRQSLHSAALETAAGYERTLKVRLLRINMQAAGLDIKSPKHQGQHQQGAGFGDAADFGDLAGVSSISGGKALRSRGKLGFGR